MTAEYWPGTALAIAGRQLWVLAEAAPDALPVAELYDLVRGEGTVADVVDLLARAGLHTTRSFAIVSLAREAPTVVVRGDLVVNAASSAGVQQISASGVMSWLETRLADDVRELTVGRADATTGSPPLPLDTGVVLAGVLRVRCRVDAHAAVAGSAPVAPAAAAASAVSIAREPPPEVLPPLFPLPGAAEDPVAGTTVLKNVESAAASGKTTPIVRAEVRPGRHLIDSVPGVSRPAGAGDGEAAAPRRGSAPSTHGPGAQAITAGGGAVMVPAARCAAGHLNSPADATCRVCRTPVPDQARTFVPRPVLGRLRLSTGDTIPLDRGVLMGRNPRLDRDRGAERPHLVRLSSPEHGISRTHAEIQLDGWHVVLVDLRSTNGTVLTLPGQAPQRLRPDEPVPIPPGSSVCLGGELTFVYEAGE